MSSDRSKITPGAREELVAAAAALAPLLERNATRAERDRRLPEENVQALREAGLLRLWQPRRLGGLEVDLRTYAEVIAALARSSCGSSAWYGFILNGSAWLVGTMAEAAQQDVWGRDPGAQVCSQLAPTGAGRPVDGGILLSGSWTFASGCHHAQWTLVGYPICDAGGTPVDHGLALVPLADLTIHDSWYMSGLSGTASDTVSGADLFVPEHRILPLSQLVTYRYATEHVEETLFRSTFAPTGTLMLAPVIVGLAEGAFEATRQQIGAGTKRVAYTFLQDTRRAPTTQLALAEASVRIDAALLQMRAAADAIDAAAKTGEAMDLESRSLQRTRLASAVQNARSAVDLLLDIGGAGAFALSNPVQRMWRDMSVGARHGFLHAENNRAIYGRVLVGAEETTTPLT